LRERKFRRKVKRRVMQIEKRSLSGENSWNELLERKLRAGRRNLIKRKKEISPRVQGKQTRVRNKGVREGAGAYVGKNAKGRFLVKGVRSHYRKCQKAP